MVAKCTYVKDKLKGDEENKIQVVIEQEIVDQYEDEEK